MDTDDKDFNRDNSNDMGLEDTSAIDDNSNEELDEDLPDEQQTIREKRIAQLRPYQWKKGQSGNSLGRYMGGISGKERMRRKIAGMTDDEFEDFIEGMNKKDLFEMAEGKPETSGDLNVKAELKIEISEDIANKYNDTAQEPENNSPEQGEVQSS